MRLTVPLQDGHVRRDCEAGRWIVADWVEILREQRATGEQTAREVPAILDNPAVSEEQVQALFSEL